MEINHTFACHSPVTARLPRERGDGAPHEHLVGGGWVKQDRGLSFTFKQLVIKP